MGVRRVKSAPADLAAMAHAKRAPPPVGLRKTFERKRGEYEQDTLFAVTCEASRAGGVADPTEQLLLFLVAKHATALGERRAADALWDVLLRLACSYVTHQLMAWILHAAPSRSPRRTERERERERQREEKEENRERQRRARERIERE